jgi:hypothetical protein
MCVCRGDHICITTIPCLRLVTGLRDSLIACTHIPILIYPMSTQAASTSARPQAVAGDGTPKMGKSDPYMHTCIDAYIDHALLARPQAVGDVEAVEEGVGDPGGRAGGGDDEGVHHLMLCVWGLGVSRDAGVVRMHTYIQGSLTSCDEKCRGLRRGHPLA